MHFKPGADDNDGAGTGRTQVSAVFLMMWREKNSPRRKDLGLAIFLSALNVERLGGGGLTRSTKVLQHFSVLEKSEKIVMKNKNLPT